MNDDNCFYDDFEDFGDWPDFDDQRPTMAEKLQVKLTGFLFDVSRQTYTANIRFDATAVCFTAYTAKYLPLSIKVRQIFDTDTEIRIGRRTIFTSEVIHPKLNNFIGKWHAVCEYWGASR